MVWDDRISRSTRGRILALLRRNGHTVNELATVLGISDNAVRTHLSGLERDGLVQPTDVMRSTGGKPAQVYELSDRGIELFPRAYSVFLAELVGVLADRQAAVQAKKLLREVGTRAAAKSAARGGDLRSRVGAAADALRALGGDVEVEEVAGGFRLKGHGCPLRAVVAEQPEACVMAEAFVAAMTGASVTERCEKGERPRCAFEVLN